MPPIYAVAAALAGGAVVGLEAPSWAALAAGLAIALIADRRPPAAIKRLTTIALQLGVIALGAGMDLGAVWSIGSSGAAVTAVALAAAIGAALLLGRVLGVRGDTPLLIGVGTAICGGSAIAAVASVIDPDERELSVSLAIVFVLNAVALIAFPLVGHALGLDEPTFGRWAALGIHDTSSVVGAGLAYGPTALAVATTTKLARALWIVPVVIAVAIARRRRGGDLARVRWPWFIAGFAAMAAAFTWLPALAPAAPMVTAVGRRALLAALFLIGLGLSREAIARTGGRALALGVLVWLAAVALALPLAGAAG